MATQQHTIAVVTGTRAEFGLLLPVMRAIRARRGLQLRTVVTGAHLISGTWRDVRDAGFEIDAKVRMQRKDTSGRVADVAALGRGVRGLGEAFARLRPDVVLVLGDRIEAFAAASAASVGGLRVAHIHGGDRAEGVADEAMRHAVSKLAHLHFAATVQSRKRLVRMGEVEGCVYNVGSPAVDGLRDVEPAGDAPDVVVMQHPIGESDARERQWMRGTLRATAKHERLVLAPNHDPGREGIMRALREVKVEAVTHLPRARFLAMLRGARAIVGNSSAGLIEAAALRTACVNVGPRQGGRERPGSVVDCEYGEQRVRAALRRALAMDLRRMRHPYGDGCAGQRIAEVLGEVDLAGVPVRKQNAY
ncbi:MAG: UDP-N-acetylglucosamine 2-epimerase [Phycisphaeraceae bacterium]